MHERLIFVGTHHKTGTMLFKRIFSGISTSLGLQFFSGWQADLPPDTDVWFMEHSRINLDPTVPLRGIHVVRHPVNIILSGYRYHNICSEPWAVDPKIKTSADGIQYEFSGMSYQQMLNSLPESEGIKLEMRGRSFNAIMDAYRWDYDDRRFLNLRLEDVVADFDAQLSRAFAWLGLPADRSLEIARRYDLARMSKEAVDSLNHITDKSRRGDRIARLSPELSREFASIYPVDVATRLGYRSLDSL